ncbi:ATP-binding protein [Nocardia sp. CDC159]|uniref:histidine kinase n=1 Tax=Nocardia pulmonis TaxID=2951408 RepID=A0A9X2E8U2_9NOCA|nr:MULTISPECIES: ATP-binding protein [Nocardia]MCM6775730.1 ATP-binding protein [Nocardia pulmonis]MCM6788294.1 ATP-binding protein [Nocardia sp. CDC159]
MRFRRRQGLTLAGQVFLVQLLVLVAVIAIGATLAVWEVRREQDEATRQLVTGIAIAVAQSPATIAAVHEPNPTALLQPVTERIRKQTRVDFIVVMAPDRTRYTHTQPDRIGKPFSGNIYRALRGETFTETFTGTLGPSIRVVTPVRDEIGGGVIALVSVGVTRAAIGDQVAEQLPFILGAAGVGLVLATLSSLALRRRLLRQTHGLAPAQLRALYEHHDAVLHSVHEGLVVFDQDAEEAAVVNDEARKLLELPDGPVRRTDLPVSLRRLGMTVIRDEMHVTAERVLVVNQDVVTWSGRPLGTVLTVRDHTELRDMMGELNSMRGLADSLRAQAHESANRLHTVITMVELGRPREAVEFATAELRLSQALIDRLTGAVHEPALAALLLGKVDQALERGVELSVAESTALDSAAPLSPHEMVTLVGNLVDNALDAVAQRPDAWVEVTVRQDDAQLYVRVADSGAGMSEEVFTRAMERGYSTKTDHQGLGLALVRRLVARYGGTLEAERTPESAVVVRIPVIGGRS